MGIRRSIERLVRGQPPREAGAPDAAGETPGVNAEIESPEAITPAPAPPPSPNRSRAHVAYDAVTDLVDRRPGLFLRWLGIVVVLSVLGAEYLEWHVVEAVVFVASLAAGVAILMFGTIIDLSADRVREKAAETDVRVAVAEALLQERSRR